MNDQAALLDSPGLFDSTLAEDCVCGHRAHPGEECGIDVLAPGTDLYEPCGCDTYEPESEVRLDVAGYPVPWASPQFNKKTGGRIANSRQTSHVSKIIAAWERTGMDMFPIDTPLLVSVQAFRDRPADNWRANGQLKDWVPPRPPKRPDLSNVIKLVEDALTGKAWKDDDQIVGYYEPTGKWFLPSREEAEHTIVKIRLWTPADG